MKIKFSRKDFLKIIGLSLFWANSIPILAKEKKIATVRKMVKITNVKAYAHQKASYVKVETDAGISGWGEGDHEFTPINAKIVDEILKPVLIGKDPFDTEHLWTEMFFEGFEGGSTGFVPGAVAGVDNALWDLKGRILEMPVSKLLGGNKLEKIAVYGSYGRRKKGGFKTPDEMASEGMKFVEAGYKTIKARMQLYDRDRNPPFNFTYDCIKAIRKTVGDEIEIFVDFNNGYTAGKAIELGLKLHEHFNIKVIEEPVSSMDYAGLRQVVEALPCEVNAGEHEYNKWQFRDLIIHGNPDCLNLDLIKCGGISECKKISGMAQAFEKEIMVHNTRPTLATAASLNFIGSITNAAKVQEFAGMRTELGLNQLFNNSLKFADGFLFIPTEIGLGLEVNEKEMEKLKLK
ncbi:galactonate dehydratase [Thermoflexibacter ruber]|uniref:Galactonate dehydratase n=2 Tax=Thermoflexibacter ruber TaxID=1003 RepID=A0A1I2JG77_9BACT|nr:galactonate dehydratase [Thermoflexibacter ruber]